MNLAKIHRRLASIYGGSDWVVIADVAAAATPNVAALREWGVQRVMVVAATDGVGPLPEADLIHYTRSSGASMMDGFRAFASSLRHPSVHAAITEFDRGTTRILAPPFGAEGVFEPRAYGERSSEWMRFEDKMMIDDEFEASGVTTAPHAIVPVADAASAGRKMANAHGSVWVADNTRGWHGGGEYVRWVRSAADERRASVWLEPRSSRVRVMPFLEGLPCSIHGFVNGPGQVAAFRPVEMLIARDVDTPAFRYLGMATTWDPPPALREEMRTAARDVALHLEERVGYRGPFSIDGVATSDGFRPTELNPRMSSGFGIQAATVKELRMGLLTRAVVEGDISVDVDELERLVVSSADRQRVLRVVVAATEKRAPDSIPVRLDGSNVSRTENSSQGRLEIGPSASGSHVALHLEPESVPVGVSAAQIAVSVARLAAESWNLSLPTLEPAVAAH